MAVQHTSNQQLIVVKGLSVSYNGVKAVESVYLSVKPGEVHGLIGLNGAGKTTTIKCIVGLLKPDHVEELTVDGINVLLDQSYKSFIGYLPESPSLPEYLTPAEFLTYLAKIRDIRQGIRTRVEGMLKLFGLDGVRNRVIVELSKGLRQRIALASVFLHEPKVVILDEPFIGLDPEGQLLVKRLLEKTLALGGAALISTHMLDTAERLCHNVTIIHRGKTVTTLPVKELTRRESLERMFFRLIDYEQDTTYTGF